MNFTYFVMLCRTCASIVLTLLCIVLIVSMFALGIRAQDKQVGASVIYTHGTGTGNSDGVGARGEVVLPLNHFLTTVGEASWVVEPKIYLGDSRSNAVRARVDLRALLLFDSSAVPFISVGGSAVHQSTSLYSKSAFNPTLGAGFNIRNRVVPFWRHYITERQTQNKVSADELAVELYFPLNERWLIRGGLAGINSRFTQPPGHPNEGRHSVWTMTMHTGIAFKF